MSARDKSGMANIKDENPRFSSKRKIINGYFCISDKDNEDCNIWVDCSEDQLVIFMSALNRYNVE